MRMPTLTTARLTIRELTLDDLDGVQVISDEGFGAAPLDERRVWLEWTTRNYDALAKLYQPPYGERGVTLAATGELIGMVGLVPALGPFYTLPSFQAAGEPQDRFNGPEFGLYWAVRESHRGQGYAAEAARALIDYGFGTLNLRRMVATTEHDNSASIAVMRKLGMQIDRNPYPDPPWFQVVGVLLNTRQ